MVLMIVEDNARMRRLIKSLLADLAEAIFECEDGDEVLAAFDLHHPDWVVMDVEMKRMDGLRATAQLIARHPEAKVIIVTKLTDAQTRSAARGAGASDFVMKDDLFQIRHILNSGQISVTTPPAPSG